MNDDEQMTTAMIDRLIYLAIYKSGRLEFDNNRAERLTKLLPMCAGFNAHVTGMGR